MTNLNKSNNFTRKLSRQILRQFFTTIFIYFGVILLLFFVGEASMSMRVWKGNEFEYPLLRFISVNRVSVITGIFLFGLILIFIPFWIRTLGYLEKIINATRNVYDSNDNLIELPDELNEVEKQLNQIKINIRNNEQAAKIAEQRKNDLVVYLAHDLKTPLTSVIGYLTLLRDESQISPELREKYLTISLEKAERLEDLINEFFEITRFNLTNLSLELSNINLTRMLEQISYEFEPILVEKSIKCLINSAPDLEIKCDANKLQRVFDNLFRNAANYSFENSMIEITVAQSKESIDIKFENHGNTIPKDKLNRIFEQFYRLDTARVTKNGGAGLGLAIAKQIIELHGGSISASSNDEIVTFHITLPIL